MEEWGSNLITTIVVIFTTIIILILVHLLARKLNRYLESVEGVQKARRQQTITFLQVVTWIISVTVICIGLLMILSEFGVDIAPLLASAGIAGLALSLGAQTLIKDFIGGFLILLENQYSVGDDIQLDTLTGQVERITLRATYVRDFRGFQYIIPNGEVRIVANLNRDWSQILVDVNIAYEEDLNHVTSVMKQAADDFVNNPDYHSEMIGEPKVIGPIVSGEWALTMRVMVKARPERRNEITRELHKFILQAVKSAGISQPYPRQESLVIAKD
jgi:small conductance mechanosensitive channel